MDSFPNIQSQHAADDTPCGPVTIARSGWNNSGGPNGDLALPIGISL